MKRTSPRRPRPVDNDPSVTSAAVTETAF